MIVPRAGISDPAAVAAHYDELDDLYRSLWGINLHHGYWISGTESAEEAVANLTRLVAEHAGMKMGDRVCDLGCGYGGAALMWNRDYGANVTGITIAGKQWRYAESAACDNSQIQYIHGDVLENGLASESFDVVTAVESSSVSSARTTGTEKGKVCGPSRRDDFGAMERRNGMRAIEGGGA